MNYPRRDPLDHLEVWFRQYQAVREQQAEPLGPQPISPTLVADALHEIRLLRRVVQLAAETVQAVGLDEESVFCLGCRMVMRPGEWELHECGNLS